MKGLARGRPDGLALLTSLCCKGWAVSVRCLTLAASASTAAMQPRLSIENLNTLVTAVISCGAGLAGPVGRVYLLWPTLAGVDFGLARVAALMLWWAHLFCGRREWGRRRDIRPTDFAVRGVARYKIHSCSCIFHEG